MSTIQLPLFPLYTVLFPGGPLPLKIFETRYLDMISQCLKDETDFGVCLIQEGGEVGRAANTVSVGVTARIIDWKQRPDGLLGITVVGEQRFRVQSVKVQKDQLAIAEMELLPPCPSLALPDEYQSLVEILKHLMAQIEGQYANLPRLYDDASWVSYRLLELLPVELQHKQEFLETDDPLLRLQRLQDMLEGMQVV